MRVRRREVFSPSPPLQLPLHLQNRIIPTQLHPLPDPPLRRRPPDITDVFRPMSHPLPFEANMGGHHAHPAHHPPPLLNTLHEGPHRHHTLAAAPNSNPRHTMEPRLDPPAQRPRSNMGLGGALLSLNRRQNEAEPDGAGRRTGVLSWPLRILRGIFGVFTDDEESNWGAATNDAEGHLERAEFLEALANLEDRQDDGPNPGLIPSRNRFRHHHIHDREGGNWRVLRLTPEPMQAFEYKKVFTHPKRPDPGFSDDFAPTEPISVSDKTNSSSGPEVGTILVCAKCLDPLITGSTESEETTRNSKLWALRCGHILDGKCIDAIMKPRPPPLPEAARNEQENESAPDIKGKSKGKGKEVDVPRIQGTEQDFEAQKGSKSKHMARNKGKRKASQMEEENDTIPDAKRSAVGPGDTGSASRLEQGPSEGDSTIRSRLRSHYSNNTSTDASTSTPPMMPSLHSPDIHLPDADSHTPSSSNTSRGRRGIGARGRGRVGRGGARGGARGGKRGRPRQPVIEAKFEWQCPVAGCLHKHLSVKINGEWVMDDRSGPIPLYV